MQFSMLRGCCLLLITFACLPVGSLRGADRLKELQTKAIDERRADWGHWGTNPDKYTEWTKHSNRLIPVYTFGISLESVAGANSAYRSAERLKALYGRVPERTLNGSAEYFDQTDVYTLQKSAAAQGKKYIVLVVFDGMDWQTTQAAAIYRSGKVGYREGRGTGLHWLDYRGAPTDFGWFVTSPHNDGTNCDVDTQTISKVGGVTAGGFDPVKAGDQPWKVGAEPDYLLGLGRDRPHAVTDSASAATSLCTGVKTYNDAINVDFAGRQVEPIAHALQRQGYAIGVVTSVPISHATPASAYAQNVHRDDFQDLTRDLLGLRSISHPSEPLPGVDVLLGGGWGEVVLRDDKQGKNFVAGNKYIAPEDLARIDVAQRGRYRMAQRTPGVNGADGLSAAAATAAEKGERLFGLYGVKKGHLPFRTADGNYDPVAGAKETESYTPSDIAENPTLADLTSAALTVLSKDPEGFWLMVEAGDVDWANHDDNIDNSIGAVISGDDAIRVITDWAEKNRCWDETALIITADHGHYLVLEKPEALVRSGE
jgi:alkaline phosphatase